MEKVAIQGYEGSFHQEAAQTFFGNDVEVLPCDTFKQVITAATSKKECDGGVMAIENSIAGSILANYNLLHKSKLDVIGEVYLRINQNLMVNKGVKVEDIKEVHSHTMALQQCQAFLDNHKWKLVETEDTALSAKVIRKKKSKSIAAIASALAAKLYDLEIIAPDIHSIKNNYTRFLILSPESNNIQIPGADKASVSFHTDHSKGSLVRVLNEIADGGINLSKLQSSPLPGSTFMYNFHADMEFDSLNQFYKVIAAMNKCTEALKVYGIYKKGKWKHQKG